MVTGKEIGFQTGTGMGMTSEINGNGYGNYIMGM